MGIMTETSGHCIHSVQLLDVMSHAVDCVFQASYIKHVCSIWNHSKMCVV